MGAKALEGCRCVQWRMHVSCPGKHTNVGGRLVLRVLPQFSHMMVLISDAIYCLYMCSASQLVLATAQDLQRCARAAGLGRALTTMQ